MIDLHMHSVYSDGCDDLKTLLENIKKAGINYFSITDHDNFDGAILMEKMLKNDNSITFIRGVEMSCEYEGYAMHILAYNFKNNAEVENLIIKSRNLRREKTIMLFNHLKTNYNICAEQKDIDELLKRDVVGKPLIAKLLKEKMGFNLSVGEIIEKYLNLPDSVMNKYKIDAKTMIETFTRAGGTVVLAHPILIMQDYNESYDFVEQIIKKFISFGLEGIEVLHSLHSEENVEKFITIAKKYNLVVTAGSDYHGKKVNDIQLAHISNFNYKNDFKNIKDLNEKILKKPFDFAQNK